jgi:hypothetical protein
VKELVGKTEKISCTGSQSGRTQLIILRDRLAAVVGESFQHDEKSTAGA